MTDATSTTLQTVVKGKALLELLGWWGAEQGAEVGKRDTPASAVPG